MACHSQFNERMKDNVNQVRAKSLPNNEELLCQFLQLVILLFEY